MRSCLQVLGSLITALYGLQLGCSGPCPEACERLTGACQQTPDSYSVAPDPMNPRGCAQVEPSVEFYNALCMEQCQDWKAEAAECLAELPCDQGEARRAEETRVCLADRGRENSERDPDDGDSCSSDCDKQARACGDACTTAHGDTSACAGCYDNCDRARASCRSWCKVLGQ